MRRLFPGAPHPVADAPVPHDAVLGAMFAVHAGESSPDAMVAGLRLAILGGALVELTGAAIALAFIRADSMEQRKA